MRFTFGNPPEMEKSAPVDEGWRSIPSLGPKRVQNYGLLMGGVVAVLVAFALHGAIQPSSLWIASVIVIFVIPFHELVHALATPGWGFTDRSVIGFQGGKGLFLPYMTYTGSLSLWRMLLSGLAPILLLSGLPVVLIWFLPAGGRWSADLGFLAFFNAAIAGGDWVSYVWISTHVPMHATVRGNGWELLWKVGKKA